MKIVTEIEELKQIIYEQKKLGKRIGLVPTMGYLHEGHGSLLKAAKETSDYVVLSIFVNPLQFGPNEDYERYPRDFERDRALAENYGTDLIFHPSVEEMYPKYPTLTKVTVAKITDVLCGSSRPGHFEGVTTVVTKLFHLVEPNLAFFGEKDAQQVAVIEQMVRDLNFPIRIVRCPTIREADGLAKSSRNVYLNREERAQATVLYRSLTIGREMILQGESSVQTVKDRIIREITTQPLAVIDYVEILTYPDLSPIDQLENQEIIIALAVKFGKTRLIDNMIFRVGS